MAVRPPRTVLDNNIDGLPSQTYIAPDQSSTSYSPPPRYELPHPPPRYELLPPPYVSASTILADEESGTDEAEEDYGDIPDFEVNKASMFPEMSTNTMLIAGGVLAVAFVIFKITRR